MDGLVQFHGGFTAVGLEFMSFHELGLAVSVDFTIMIVTFLDHIFLSSSLQLVSQSLACCLVVDLCIWFHQLLEEGSRFSGAVVCSLGIFCFALYLIPTYE